VIVKVQWPIVPPDAELFVYSKPGPGQQHWMIPQDRLDPNLLDRIQRDTKATGKAFYDASMFKTDKGAWPKIGKRVEDQSW
jgi:hypothetical protein